MSIEVQTIEIERGKNQSAMRNHLQCSDYSPVARPIPTKHEEMNYEDSELKYPIASSSTARDKLLVSDLKDNMDPIPLQVRPNRDLKPILGDGSQLSSITSVNNDGGSSQYQSRGGGAVSNTIMALKDKNNQLQMVVEQQHQLIQRMQD